MSKWVEVPITILKTYAVEIEDNKTVKDAQQYVIADCLDDDIDLGNCFIVDECFIVDDDMVETTKRCADKVLEL